MTGRARKILSRFPAHFEAARPGKQLSVVTDALARDLDEQSATMARVRRSHRLGDADELRDLRENVPLPELMNELLGRSGYERFLRDGTFERYLRD